MQKLYKRLLNDIKNLFINVVPEKMIKNIIITIGDNNISN